MKELSIFIDESGDFGDYDYRSPYYIISMVLHDQDVCIDTDLDILETELKNIGWSNHCVHAGPVIRAEAEYKEYSIKERQMILKRMMSFIRHLDIHFKSIYIEKKHIEDSVEAAGRLSKKLAIFIRENMEVLQSFDIVKVYMFAIMMHDAEFLSCLSECKWVIDGEKENCLEEVKDTMKNIKM
jgi:hypothetical protein